MTDLFVSQSVGAGKRTSAAQRRFEMRSRNRQGRVDVMRYARWDALNRRYVFHPSIRCSVGQLISPFLSQTQIAATWPTSHVLSSITFDTLLTGNESTCRIPSPHSAYPISSSSCQEKTQGGSDDERKGGKRMKMSDETRCKVRYKRVSTDLYIGGTSPIGTCIYGKGNMYGKGNVSLTHPQHYLSNTLSTFLTAFPLRIYEGVFRWIRHNLNKSDNYDGRKCYVTIPESTRPSQIHPHPSYYLLANSPPPSSLSASLLGVGSPSNSSSKATRRNFLPQ
jgi:hypothetical protein